MPSQWLLIMVCYIEQVVVSHGELSEPVVVNHVWHADLVVVNHRVLC